DLAACNIFSCCRSTFFSNGKHAVKSLIKQLSYKIINRKFDIQLVIRIEFLINEKDLQAFDINILNFLLEQLFGDKPVDFSVGRLNDGIEEYAVIGHQLLHFVQLLLNFGFRQDLDCRKFRVSQPFIDRKSVV